MRKYLLARVSLSTLLGVSTQVAFASSSPSFAGTPTEMPGAPALQQAPPALTGQARFASPQTILPSRLIQVAPQDFPKPRAARSPAVVNPEGYVGTPSRMGEGIEVTHPQIDLSRVNWVPLPDGRRAGKFEIAAAKAAGLRAAMHFSTIPEGMVLHIAGSDRSEVFEVLGQELPKDKDYWTPAVEGEVLKIELVLPKNTRPEAITLRVPRLSYLKVSPYKANYTDGFKYSTCTQDVACSLSPPLNDAARGVVKLLFTDSWGDTSGCTGTLLDNDHPSKRSLVWSAAHCIKNQAEANTLQTIWFYRTTVCRGDASTINKNVAVLTGGATLLHRNVKRDTLLLELKSAPPAGAFYVGWKVERLALGEVAVGIHHPQGDVMKFSRGNVVATGDSFLGVSPVTRVFWSNEGLEARSSGSGLFTVASDRSFRLCGGLVGGPDDCQSQGPYYYSDFSDVYPEIAKYFAPTS